MQAIKFIYIAQNNIDLIDLILIFLRYLLSYLGIIMILSPLVKFCTIFKTVFRIRIRVATKTYQNHEEKKCP